MASRALLFPSRRRSAGGTRIVIQPQRGWIPTFWKEIGGYRDLLLSFVRRDVSIRYKQTILGPVWVLLQPALVAATFAFLFHSVAKVSVHTTVSYFVFALVGMSLWTGFSNGLTRATNSFLMNVDIVSKIYFPRVLLPISAALASAVDSLVIQCGVVIYLLIGGPGLGVQALAIIPITAVLVCFAACLAAGLGALLVNRRDVQYGLPLFVQSLLLFTPILYPLSTLAGKAKWVADINPLTPLFEAQRWALLSGPAPSTGQLIYGLGLILVISFLALCVFTRLERSFADVI